MSVQGDAAFRKGVRREYLKENQYYLNEHGITFRTVPPFRHSKNPLKSKHGVIRSIFLKLCTAEPQNTHELQALRAISICNDLCANDVMSLCELARGFSKPLTQVIICLIPSNVVDAHNRLQAKRKLALILKSKSMKKPQVATGDIIEVYTNPGLNNMGKLSTPKIVLAVDPYARTVLVPAKVSRRDPVASKDIRMAHSEDSVSTTVQ